MANITNEEAVWKTYPDPKYPFIEANQFGEIRTKDRTVTGKNGKKYHIKGRILKQHLKKSGYMYVSFRMNGKTVYLRAHRIIATCFVPNPNDYPEVNHIDNDRTNNAASNLEWCTRKYNETYKKNFGTTQAELFGKPVFAVDLKTGKVLRFESQHEAARKLGINVIYINKVVKGKQNQTGGYWFTEDESEITEEKIQEIRASMHFFGGVVAINLGTSEIFCFESQAEAARQLNVDPSTITKVIKGKLNKAGGCWFTRVDENAVEKTRAEFGDDLAREVEKTLYDVT